MPAPRNADGIGALRSALAAGAFLFTVGSLPAVAVDDGLRCEKAAAARLRVCTKKVNAALRRCYVDGGGPCAAADPRISRALAALETRLRRRCPNDAAVQAAGFGSLMTVDGLVARLAEACRGESAALAARTFGGPHGAVIATADVAAQTCLSTAHRQGSRLVDSAWRVQSGCVRKTRAGRSCDTIAVALAVQSQAAEAVAEIGAACGDLAALVAVDPAQFVARADAQVRCMLAAAHPDPAPLSLDCGPRPALSVSARGVATQVVLDEATRGSRCGDGSSYAFQVRLAPAGAAVEKVVIFMQGGGVCLFEAECAAVSAGLLRALDNGMPSGGFFSTSSTINPT